MLLEKFQSKNPNRKVPAAEPLSRTVKIDTMSQHQIPRQPVARRRLNRMQTIKEESRKAGSLSSSPVGLPSNQSFDLSYEEFIKQFELDIGDSDLNKYSSRMFKLRQSLLVAPAPVRDSAPASAPAPAPISTVSGRLTISAPLPCFSDELGGRARIQQDDEWHWDRDTVLLVIDAEGMLAVLDALIRNETGEWAASTAKKRQMRQAWIVYLVVSKALKEIDGRAIRIWLLFHSLSSECIDHVKKSTKTLDKTADKISKGLSKLIGKDPLTDDIGDFVHKIIRRMINIQRMKEEASRE